MRNRRRVQTFVSLWMAKRAIWIHGTVPPHQVNKATVHATVTEFWYVLEGHGEILRDNGVESCITVHGSLPVARARFGLLSAGARWNNNYEL
jgi:mannose-6-phosphate isomerase-like protein (cupin superfamily)